MAVLGREKRLGINVTRSRGMSHTLAIFNFDFLI